MKTVWKKVYVGPFTKREAQGLAYDIVGTKIYPDATQTIFETKIRKRKASKSFCVCTAACGAGRGHNEKYDVWAKVVKNDDHES